MRLLWSLPRAVPALLRHLAGYVELAGQDLERAQHDFGARLVADVIFGLSLFFVIFCCCLAVIALSWDTPYRLTAIAAMGGIFVLLAIGTGVYRSRLIGRQGRLLATVREEWKADSVILEHVLSANRRDT
ncbi:MAG: hypothetical protein NVSMB10_11360 [Steroidobacteraceae bacterium]